MKDTRLYYFAESASFGLLDASEKQSLDAWLDAAPENRVHYAQICAIVEFGSQYMADVDAQTDAEWAKLDTAIAPHTIVAPMIIRPPFWSGSRIWAAAAAIALLAVVGGYFAFFKGNDKPLDAQHYATALGETKEIQLADGSHVRLNGGSTLDAAAGYGQTDRKLTLHGEAYFEVAKDKARPFIVGAGATYAEALGTKFNVRMSSADQGVQLSVTEGRVRFSADKFKELILTEGQVAHFDPSKGFVRETMVAHDAAGWVDQRLIFKDTPFQEVAEQIERTYGVTLDFPEHLNAGLVNANFDRKPLSDVLDVLESMYGVEASQSGKVVTLSE
jgi:transmembrane sensor